MRQEQYRKTRDRAKADLDNLHGLLQKEGAFCRNGQEFNRICTALGFKAAHSERTGLNERAKALFQLLEADNRFEVEDCGGRNGAKSLSKVWLKGTRPPPTSDRSRIAEVKVTVDPSYIGGIKPYQQKGWIEWEE